MTDRPASQQSFAGAAGAISLPPPADVIFTTLAWQASPSPEAIGYAVYYRMADFATTNRLDAGKALAATIPLHVDFTYLIYVVAYTEDGIESAPSNLLKYTPPPLSPVRLVKLDTGEMQLRFRTTPLALCRVEWTDDLASANWQTLATLWAGLQGEVVLVDTTANGLPVRFYRVVKL